MSEAPAVIAIHPDDAKELGNPACDSIELDLYVYKPIFDAYKAAVDAWLDYEGSVKKYGSITNYVTELGNLMQAARKAGESVK